MNQTGWRIAFLLWFLILVFGFVFGTRRAEPAFVMAFVDRVVTLRGLCFRDSAPELTHAFIVKRISGAHEDVVAAMFGIQTKLARHPREIADDVISLLFGCAPRFLCRTLDIDAVFVGAGQEIGLDAALSFRARDRV